MANVTISNPLDLSPHEISAGSYVLRLVNPENGQPSLAVSSTTNCDFLLPNLTTNLSRSFLEFNLVWSDAGNTTNYCHFHNGFLAAIDGMILSTQGNVRLAEVNNIPEYTTAIWRACTDLKDFMTFPCHSNSELTVATVTEAGQYFNRIRAIQDLTGDPAYAASGACINSEAGTSQEAGSDDYTAVSRYVSAVVIGANNGTGNLAMRVRLPLNMIYHSIFNLDKNLYFNEQLRLTVRFNQGAKFGFLSATSARSVAAASTDFATAPAISGVCLRLAVETNESIKSSMVSRVRDGEGISLRIPYPYVFKGTGSSSTGVVESFIRKVNRGNGDRLLRCYGLILSAAQTGARYCNSHNGTAVAPIKWSNYRWYLDSKPLSDDVCDLLGSGVGTAWENHKNMFLGSCYKGMKDWLQSPVVIQDFSGVPQSKDFPETDGGSSGLDLAVEREIAFQYTSVAASLNFWLFYICQKVLTINKMGVSVL